MQASHSKNLFNQLASILMVVGFVCMALSGCGTNPPKQKPLEDVVLVPENKKVSIPDETLRECDGLPKMQERVYSEAETLQFMQTVISVHSDCKQRKHDETTVVKKAFNLNSTSK